MGFDKIVVERTVYNADDWLGVVGGFMGSVEFIFIVLVPMLTIWNLEKYLVTTLFHRYIELQDTAISKEELRRMEYQERKLAQINMSLRERKRIEPSQYPSLIENFREYLAKCFKKLKLNDEDYYFRKARLRMSKEMDIKNFIKSLRTNRNTIKFLTTQPERRFVKM
jgi:hypothetical protein